MQLVEDVYRVTRGFPRDELYGLTAQIRRSAISIPSNIAEGIGRHSDREFSQFLRHARGSILELETQLLIGQRLKYVDDSAAEQLMKQTAEIGRMLNGLLKAFREDSPRT
jgi:four helix bundle protein